MENTKIGNKEAFALLVTITFNHIILNVTKIIIDYTESASLLNLLYVGIIAVIFTCATCYFLNKFPTFDLIDISKYLGGDILKWIIGIAYIGYFIFFSGVLLHMFASHLQIIYFPLTKLFYIILLFIIATIFACTMKYNAVYRSTLIFFPFLIISLIFLFVSDTPYFHAESIYPIWGKGIFVTFLSGICNMFAFQAIAYIYFMPPMLKEPNKVKEIAVNAIIWSCILLLIGVATILFMFHGVFQTHELMPLYSAVKYIEFGSFFRKLDSIFLLIWIISFVSYLSIIIDTCCNIVRKSTSIVSTKFTTILIASLMLVVTFCLKTYAVSTFLADVVYKYAFFIMMGISIAILLIAYISKKFKVKSSSYKISSNSLTGGTQ